MKYKAPEGVTSINVGGEQFDVDDLGHITVPADGNYAVLVASHGFVPADAGETSSEQAAGDERPARGRKPAAPSGQETSTTTAQADSEGLIVPDLVTLADVKRHLGTAATSDDALLSSLITQVSSAVASRLSRELLTGARTETRDGNGKTKLVLNDYPVTAVSSVVVDGIAIPPAPDVLTPGYRFSSTAITLNGYCFARGQQNVELAYTAGFAAVPEDVQLAVLDTVALAYKQRDHLDVSSKSLAGETISYITTDLTPAAKARLAPYRRTFSF